MSDHERGAYSPPTDAPLSFDAREPVRGARPIPFTLIISILVLLGLAAAIFVFYRSGVRQAGQPPQTVGAPVGGMKAPPPAEAQPQDPAAGLQIYKTEGGKSAAPAAPQFTPAPEEPAARPQAPAPQIQVLAGDARRARRRGPGASPVVSRPNRRSGHAGARAQGRIACVKAGPDPGQGSAASSGQTGRRQAGNQGRGFLRRLQRRQAPPSCRSALSRRRPWPTRAGATLRPVAPGAAAGKGKNVEKVDKDGKTLFRTQLTGFASRAEATAFCDKLKAVGKACFVK